MIGNLLCINKSLSPFEPESFTKLNWLVLSGLVILDRGDSEKDATIPLSIIIPRSLLFKFSSAWLLFDRTFCHSFC